MNQLLLLTLLAAVAAVSGKDQFFGNQSAEGAPVFKFREPTFFGSGCPADSVRVVTSSDGQSVSVLFSDYIAGTTTENNRVRKSCNLAVPVDVQRGWAIGIFRVDYRGYAYVPRESGSYANFDVEYYFAGSQGPRASERYSAGFDDDIFISHKLGAVAWTPCGASTNFRVNSGITAYKKNKWSQDPEIAIDSIDATIERGFRYYFHMRRC